jgi:putative intracellular protease/amidase
MPSDRITKTFCVASNRPMPSHTDAFQTHHGDSAPARLARWRSRISRCRGFVSIWLRIIFDGPDPEPMYAVKRPRRAANGIDRLMRRRDNRCMMITHTFLLMIATLIGLACGPGQQVPDRPSPPATTLAAPATGKIRVAFVVTEDAVMIDFAGPWEVFQDVMVPSRGASMHDQHVFELYTVSDTRKPIRVSGGMQVVPDYTFEDAPEPRVVVVPAQDGNSPKMMDWLRRMAGKSDVVMSVCAGAFQLGEAGLLKGKKATTHHGSYAHFQSQFPDIQVQRDVRYVQSDRTIFTAGGFSSGIDLALHGRQPG